MARSAAALKPALVADAAIPVAPLSSFVIAAENPRTIRPKDAISALAANLAANGVLTPVICYELGGKLHITCGGTRFLAAKEAGIEGLPYDRRTSIKAIEAGLAEQEGHAPLHPADQAVAFKAEVDRFAHKLEKATKLDTDGWSRDEAIKRIANRVGRSERFVLQRLALADLHSPILRALRENKITVHQAEAWANADMEQQEELWRSRGKHAGELDPVVVKHLIDKLDLAANNRLAKFVGEAAYRTAGGVIRQDLFPVDGDDKAVGHLDPDLVKKLAREKLAVARKKIEAEGWGEVKATLAVSHMGYGEKAKPKTKEARAKYGAHVSIDHNGKLVTVRGLPIRKAEKPDPAAKQVKTQPANDWNSKEARAAREIHERTCHVAEQIVGRSMRSFPGVALALLLARLARELILKQHVYDDIVGLDVYVSSRTYHGLASDADAKRWQDELTARLAKQDDLVDYIANTMTDHDLGQLLVLLVAIMMGLDEASADDPNESRRRQLAQIAGMVNVDFNAHLVGAADKIDLPLLQELLSPKAPEPKPTKKSRVKK